MLIQPVTMTIGEYVMQEAITCMEQRLKVLQKRTSRRAANDRERIERYLDDLRETLEAAVNAERSAHGR